MKVAYDAILDDFVDVHKRSVGRNLRLYVTMAIVAVALSAMVGGLMYLFLGDWLAVGLGATLGLVAGGFAIVRGQDDNIRTYLKKRFNLYVPVPTEVEINEIGVSTRCLGQIVTYEWKVVENIEETKDAIYFRNKYGLYCSVRNRGFGSEDEKKEFFDLAKHYWSQATVPDPPNFEAQQ